MYFVEFTRIRVQNYNGRELSSLIWRLYSTNQPGSDVHRRFLREGSVIVTQGRPTSDGETMILESIRTVLRIDPSSVDIVRMNY